MEGLGEVVVATCTEASKTFVQLASRCEEEHRTGDPGTAKGEAHVTAVGVGKTDVEHNGLDSLGGCQGCPTVRCGDDGVARFAKRPRQRLTQGVVVLNHKHAVHESSMAALWGLAGVGAVVVRSMSGDSTQGDGMTSTVVRPGTPGATMLNKVPEVTIWFWIIKILCTTVGESFADYINETLGFGLTNTTLVFSAALIAVLVWQFRLRGYVPGVYWTAVVLISVVGTLLTDNLTDSQGVPLWLSTTIFTVLLAIVFAVWYARERTLSIHSIVTTPREAFYWLAVLVTFALGTAAGDWTLDLTGWTPGYAVLLPAGLIAAVFVAWRLGAGPVLSFWIAYILTRPLGANLGDFLGADKADGGLGWGTLVTSLVFLSTILVVVVYLTITKVDRTENRAPEKVEQPADA